MKKIQEIIKQIDVKYTSGKESVSVLDAMTSTIVFYENYVVKVIRGKDYADSVKKVQTYGNAQYIYNFPYETSEISGYTIVPMDKLTMVDPDLRDVISRIPIYLQHPDLYKIYKPNDTDTFTTSKTKYRNTLTTNAKPIYDNILSIFSEYKIIFGEVFGDKNTSNYAVVNDRVILFDI